MSLSLSSASLYKQAEGGNKATAPTATTTTQSSTNNNNINGSNDTTGNAELDFIASDVAVKKLFSLPYAATGQSISVAVHNLDGTLLLDNDAVEFCQPTPTLQSNLPDFLSLSSSSDGTTNFPQGSSSTIHSLAPPLADRTSDNHEHDDKESQNDQGERSLVPVSTIESDSGALAILKSLVATSSYNNTPVESDKTVVESLGLVSQQHQQQQHMVGTVEENKVLDLPVPDEYVQSYIPQAVDPRQYLPWRCRDMNLLVGSDALVYRSPTTGEASLTFRVQDIKELNKLLEQHEDAVRLGKFLPDHRRAVLQQQGKPSYAEATQEPLQIVEQHTATRATNRSGFVVPDLDQVRLQTCIVPSTPMGGMLDPSVQRGETENKALSPVSTVIDAYLDNIMANVPQLALCLQEKGFVNSVKLLQTNDIPTSFLHPSIVDTSRPFDMIQPDSQSEEVFSPQIMEMNASALLRFLKTNCTRNNTTYLLRREAGATNIQLYDISSISAQKQKKWIWWLAMMSYRFANRLRDLANRTLDAQLARACRNRQRSLLENTLDLLEVLSDMDGNARESLVAAIREHLADTFLWDEPLMETRNFPESHTPTSPAPPTTFSQRQPYQKVSADALEKAQTHLEKGVKYLWSVLQKNLERQQARKEQRREKRKSTQCSVKVTTETEEASSDSESEEKFDDPSQENEAVATQLFGMHQKLVNLYLRLGEIHLKNYFSSSAMQCLRSAARRLADSLFLVGETLRPDNGNKRARVWLHRSQLQYVWLWEHCGHFARSFGGDSLSGASLWRDRGHAGADDVLSVLRDAEAAFQENKRLLELRKSNELYNFLAPDPLYLATKGEVNLHFLSGVVSVHVKSSNLSPRRMDSKSVQAAREYLFDQHVLRREERQVFVASCLAYQRAIFAYDFLVDYPSPGASSDLMGLLQQRLGDACNEVGKIMLSALRSLLGASTDDTIDKSAIGPLLSSSFFWFEEGLDSFIKCGDLRNLSLLQCNLCQCHKLQANAIFADDSGQASLHAEKCLQEGANHLLAAHEALGMRETDPLCWDMVSGELAATYLVLGVRRRQALIGSGNVPLILETLRLSPGKERSIVEPMEKAMGIYEEMGNSHQAAATHYQLALYFSKIWTCQRDESKTREKLASAFSHYSAAHKFFSRSLKGNESTYCLLCLDLSNLYASVLGEDGVSKALLCCFDTAPAFSPDTVEPRVAAGDKQFVEQMATLASEVEDRVFKLLRNLTKLEESGNPGCSKYKSIYRAGLTAKMNVSAIVGTENSSAEDRLNAWYKVLETIQQSWHHLK